MRSNQPCWCALPVLLFLVSPGANADQADALNFFVGTSAVHDENIFRLSPGVSAQGIFGSDQRSDNIYTTFIGGSLDKLIGRQRLKMDATLNNVRFEHFSQLNNNGGNLGASLYWTLTDDLTGSLDKSRTRAMPGYRDQRTPVKNMQTVDNEFFTADLRVQPSWHLEGVVNQISSSNSAQVNQTTNSTMDAYSLGVRYTPLSGNYIGLKNTWSKGQYPNFQFVAGSLVDNGFNQDDAALEAGWTLSGISKISAVLAHTERTHRNVPERNFSGWTGNFSWDWALTGKLFMVTRIRREIGAQNDLLASYALTEAYSLTPTWTPTAKTSLRLNFEQAKRKFLGDPVAALNSLPKRNDTQKTLSLTATYQASQSLVLSLSATKETRDSNYANYSYKDNILMANAQFNF